MKKIQKISLCGFLLLLFSISLFSASFSENPPPPPKLISVQGKLTDATGKLITVPTNVTFSLYATEQGGNPLWSEQKNITPTDGIFTTLLGDTVPFNQNIIPGLDNAGTASLYLGIQAAADPEMTPRQRLTSVPFALSANDTYLVQGKKPDETWVKKAGDTMDGTLSINSHNTNYGIKATSGLDPGIGLLGQQPNPLNMGTGVYGIFGEKIYDLEGELGKLQTSILGTTDKDTAYTGFFKGGKGVVVEWGLGSSPVRPFFTVQQPNDADPQNPIQLFFVSPTKSYFGEIPVTVGPDIKLDGTNGIGAVTAKKFIGDGSELINLNPAALGDIYVKKTGDKMTSTLTVDAGVKIGIYGKSIDNTAGLFESRGQGIVTAYGVLGKRSEPGGPTPGAGVRGQRNEKNFGELGKDAELEGYYGVYGESDSTAAVYGKNTSNQPGNRPGVWGTSENSIGVYGTGGESGVTGVYKEDTNVKGELGVSTSFKIGLINAFDKYGAWGQVSENNYGMLGYSHTLIGPPITYGVYGYGTDAAVYGMNSKDFHLTGALGYYDTYIKTSFCGGSPSGWLNKDLKTGVYGKADTTQAFAGYFEGPVKVVGTLDATSLCPALIGVIKNALAGEEPLDLSGYFSKETGAEAPDSGLPPDPLWDPVPEGSMYMSAPLFWNEMASQPWAYKVGLTLALLADPSLTEYKVHNTTLWTESSLPSNLKNLRTSFKNLTTNQLPLRNEIIENGSIKSSLLAVPLSNYTVKSDLSNYATTLQLTVKADKSYVDTNFASTNNALSAKANAADVYTKVQVDSALSNKADTSALNAKANAADVYTRTAADLLLNAKADAATTYSKTDINSKLALKADTANIYSKAEVDSKLGLKANAADVYTKAAADTLLNAKANAADLGPLATAGYVTTAQVRDTTGNSIFNADGTLSAAKVGGTLTESQLPNTLLFTTSSISASQISGRLTDSQLPSTINSSRITLSSDQPLSSYVDYTYGRSGASVLLKAPAEAKGINPQTDNAYSLGASGARWSAIYAATTAIKTGDLNEKYLVEGSAEDGDVMMISGPATMKLCNQSNSTKVSGIFRGESSGFVMNDELANGKNIVLVGRYPVKVEATSSAVEPGDLLVSSSKPGYATKAPENPKPGTIIGKALEGLAQGETGKILVLVTLQ